MAVNEDINAMIDQLHARLEDVHAVASATNIELFGFAKRLDKVDDQLYLLQVDMEKFIASQLSETGVVTTAAPAAAPVAAATSEPAAPAEPAAETAEAAPAQEAAAPAAAEEQPKEKKEEGILSESAKETLSSAAKTLGEMFRDSKEVMGEITDVVKDVKDTFDIKGNLTKK
jgi:hypothetical protein